jgi:hypothetical protein
MHICDEELELYALKRLQSEQVATVESHLAACSTCNRKLPQHLAFALRLRTLSKNPQAVNGEKRSDRRIPADEPAQLRLLSPFSPDFFSARILNISKNGVKVSLPIHLASGILVQVRYQQTIVFGEVRYCVRSGAEHFAGIKIQDVFSISSFCTSFPSL